MKKIHFFSDNLISLMHFQCFKVGTLPILQPKYYVSVNFDNDPLYMNTNDDNSLTLCCQNETWKQV